ncbi:MAG: molybdopterin-guanine dinucleotide biosynthesis protein B [Myxococcota bacterium]|jgi:molybdopterin-guanine dinucleotide biosynthesis protein B|nr:molybdopterin-guanine dinucleotide biosynthesis protein B [Myxococcota bacterium]
MTEDPLEEIRWGREPVPVVAVVGFSNVGKTTLIEQLVSRLGTRGLVVGAVKHTSHGFTADRPGKDSDRIYRAGASAVTLVSRDQMATFKRRQPEQPSLGQALREMPSYLDLVLAEGFAWEPVPRLVLVRNGEAPASRHTEAGPVLAVIEVPEREEGYPPRFGADVLNALIKQLMDRVSAVAMSNGSKANVARNSRTPISLEIVKEGT